MLHDLHYAVRMLAKSPSFTFIAALTLALGIAATSTVLRWTSLTPLNPIPGAPPTSDIVTVMRGERSDHPSPPFSYPDLRDLRERTRTFAGLAGYPHDSMSLPTTNYFVFLGVHPILGRGFVPEEEQQLNGSPVAVISYPVWQNHFALDPPILRTTIQLT